MEKRYSFKRVITLSVVLVFLLFSIITFFVFNNIYFQTFRSRYISENYYAANTVRNIIEEEKDMLINAARAIANDEIVFRAFENNIYIGKNWIVKNGKIDSIFSKMDKINFKQIVNLEKRKIYNIAGGTVANGVALYKIENGKIEYIDSSMEYEKDFLDDGNEKYLKDVAGTSSFDASEIGLIQEKNGLFCIKGNSPVGKNNRYFDGRPKGIVQVIENIDGFFLEKLKSKVNREIIIINNNKILISSIFKDTIRIENQKVERKDLYTGDEYIYSEIKFGNKNYGGTLVPLKNYSDETISYVGVLYDLGIMKEMYKNTLKKYIYVELLFLLIISLIIMLLIKMLLSPVEGIVDALKKMAGGDYEFGVKESGMKELDYIISNINTLLESVKKREGELKELNTTLEIKVEERTKEINEKNILLEKKTEKIESDLNMAKKVHNKMTQFNIPVMKNYDIYFDNRAVRGIGGDFIDCVQLNNGKYGIVFVDIAGHGLSASLIVSAIKLVVNSYFKDVESPSDALYLMNELINDTFIEGITVSMAYMIIDDEAGTILMASGAQEEILKIGDTVCPIEEKGIILGAVGNNIIKTNKNISYKDTEIKLNKGEKLFLYTDGLIEAENYGREQLVSMLENIKDKNGLDMARSIHEHIVKAVVRDERDDVSYMIIEKK